jgi:hypothetical protein
VTVFVHSVMRRRQYCVRGVQLALLHRRHQHPRPTASRACSASTTRSSSTCCTGARRLGGRGPRRQAIGLATYSRKPGSLTAAGCLPRTSPPTWPPGAGCSGLYDCDGVEDTEPDVLRYRLRVLPAQLVRRAPRTEDQPHLALGGRIPDLLAAAIHSAATGLTSHPVPATRKAPVPAR